MKLFSKRTPVKLPVERIDTADIAHMGIGETAYTVPWAMMVDEDMNCWINSTYSVTSRPFGTSSMRIRRVEDGVEVIAWAEYYRAYRPQSGIPWVGASPSDVLPVVAVPR